MNNLNTTIKVSQPTNELLKAILAELHLLRSEMNMIFGEDDIDNYAHPEKIKQSYKEALKDYPKSL